MTLRLFEGAHRACSGFILAGLLMACGAEERDLSHGLDTNYDPSSTGTHGDGSPSPGVGSNAGTDSTQDADRGSAGGTNAGATSEAPDAGSDAGPAGPTFPGVIDFAAPGPFTTLNEPGGANCTVFRPMTLGDNGLRHPVIVWGNGTLSSPTLYSGALGHWASHGFIVAAANTTNAGTGMEMLACLDWVLDEDARAGSPYEGHVDRSHAGASGHSQGGGGTIMAGRDARIGATVPLEPYTQGLGHDAASQSQQRGPMLLLSGSADTIAPSDGNQRPVFESVNVPTFWGTLAGADHITSATGDITGFRGPATAWLRLHLMGDESARALFYDATCTLCSDSMWTVQRKNIQ